MYTRVASGPAKELDRGSPFDLFDSRSHTDYPHLSPLARTHRDQLRNSMQTQGFRNLDVEWWHYTLKDEPHTDQYFDFEISAHQKPLLVSGRSK